MFNSAPSIKMPNGSLLPVPCKFCGNYYDPIHLKDIHHNFEHDDLCDLYKDVCPNNCADSSLVLWKKHKRVCIEKSLKCPYKNIGCESIGIKERSMQKHLFEEGYKHAEMLMKHIDNLNNELTCVKNELTNVKRLIPGSAVNNGITDMSEAIEKLNSDMDVLQVKQAESEEKIRKNEWKLGHSTGLCYWEIKSFDNIRNSQRIYSPPFYTHDRGYRMQLELRKNYNHIYGTNISIYAKLMIGEYDDELPWPCEKIVTVVLLDQERRNRDFSNIIYFDCDDTRCLRPSFLYGECIGYDSFIDDSLLSCREYLILNGNLWINCFVDDY